MEGVVTPLFVQIGVALFLVAFGYWWLGVSPFERQQNMDEISTPTIALSSCPNPDCVRCRKYGLVQKTAKSRLPWIARELSLQFPNDSLDRVKASIRNPIPPQSPLSSVQAPTVLMVSGLKSQEVVTKLHSKTCNRLIFPQEQENTTTMILRELQQVPNFLWDTNDSPDGSWRVLSMLNQGTWNQDICEICPGIFDLIRGLPNLMDECLFGNVIISKICAGTTIEPHCGPTNVRHRLQYALKIPTVTSLQSNENLEYGTDGSSRLCLHVGTDTKLQWKEPGDVFVFDDSFMHSVKYKSQNLVSPANECNDDVVSSEHDDNSRMVLIVDLWHPDLTPAERKLIQLLYPPFSVSPG